MNVGKWLHWLLLLVLLAALVLPPAALANHGDEAFIPGQVVVKLRGGVSLAEVGERYGATVIGELPKANTFLLRLPVGMNTEQTLQAMRGDPSIAQASPNYTVWLAEAQQISVSVSGEQARSDPDPNPALAERYHGQWAAKKIGLDRALARSRGAGVTVAVLDTGVDRAHPALVGKLLPGRDFVGGDDEPSEELGGGASGHGTFVGGIVALTAPEAKILPVRVLDRDGRGSLFGVIQGLTYAADQGAQVISLSLGASRDASALKEAVRDVVDRGALVVAAAGNRPGDGEPGSSQGATLLYPAQYDEVLAVAATDPDDLKASFSRWGTKVDLAAPGVEIYSSYAGGGYAWWSGTSSATAFVSGASVLLWAEHPEWSSQEVEGWLKAEAQHVDALNAPYLRGKLGAGRLDLAAVTQPEL